MATRQPLGWPCDMVARMLRESGVFEPSDIPDGWLLPAPSAQRELEVTQAVVAPSMEVRFARDWRGLETLPRAGDLIGWADGEPLATTYDGCTFIMPSLRQLRPRDDRRAPGARLPWRFGLNTRSVSRASPRTEPGQRMH